MIAGDIQKREVVVVPLNFRSFDRGKPEAFEGVFDLATYFRHWVEGTPLRGTRWKRDIDLLARECLDPSCRCDFSESRVEGVLERLFCGVRALADPRAITRRQSDKALHRFGEKPLATQSLQAPLFESRGTVDVGEAR
jgi:hypothetical protein